jgi:hypothetical protein
MHRAAGGPTTRGSCSETRYTLRNLKLSAALCRRLQLCARKCCVDRGVSRSNLKRASCRKVRRSQPNFPYSVGVSLLPGRIRDRRREAQYPALPGLSSIPKAGNDTPPSPIHVIQPTPHKIFPTFDVPQMFRCYFLEPELPRTTARQNCRNRLLLAPNESSQTYTPEPLPQSHLNRPDERYKIQFGCKAALKATPGATVSHVKLHRRTLGRSVR